MTSAHRPGREDLARAHEAFRAHESRDLFYRAAIALVGLARESVVDLTTGEAIAVLLRTWNSAYYNASVTAKARESARAAGNCSRLAIASPALRQATTALASSTVSQRMSWGGGACNGQFSATT